MARQWEEQGEYRHQDLPRPKPANNISLDVSRAATLISTSSMMVAFSYRNSLSNFDYYGPTLLQIKV
jgi:hypothetical protein